MITAGRHRPLAKYAWDESAVRAAIEEIAVDATVHFHPDAFWPAHPNDDGVGDGNPSFYYGAGGVIWALDYLHRIGATRVADDFRPVLPKLLERTIANFESNSPADYAKHACPRFDAGCNAGFRDVGGRAVRRICAGQHLRRHHRASIYLALRGPTLGPQSACRNTGLELAGLRGLEYRARLLRHHGGPAAME